MKGTRNERAIAYMRDYMAIDDVYAQYGNQMLGHIVTFAFLESVDLKNAVDKVARILRSKKNDPAKLAAIAKAIQGAK